MSSPPSILLIEDNPLDLDLTCRALRRGGWDGTIEVARDGEEALAWIPRWDAGRMRPNLVLLDLKLPKDDGHEVLRRLKQHPEHRAIPVVVLSASGVTVGVSAALPERPGTGGDRGCHAVARRGDRAWQASLRIAGGFSRDALRTNAGR